MTTLQTGPASSSASVVAGMFQCASMESYDTQPVDNRSPAKSEIEVVIEKGYQQANDFVSYLYSLRPTLEGALIEETRDDIQDASKATSNAVTPSAAVSIAIQTTNDESSGPPQPGRENEVREAPEQTAKGNNHQDEIFRAETTAQYNGVATQTPPKKATISPPATAAAVTSDAKQEPQTQQPHALAPLQRKNSVDKSLIDSDSSQSTAQEGASLQDEKSVNSRWSRAGSIKPILANTSQNGESLASASIGKAESIKSYNSGSYSIPSSQAVMTEAPPSSTKRDAKIGSSKLPKAKQASPRSDESVASSKAASRKGGSSVSVASVASKSSATSVIRRAGSLVSFASSGKRKAKAASSSKSSVASVSSIKSARKPSGTSSVASSKASKASNRSKAPKKQLSVSEISVPSSEPTVKRTIVDAKVISSEQQIQQASSGDILAALSAVSTGTFSVVSSKSKQGDDTAPTVEADLSTKPQEELATTASAISSKSKKSKGAPSVVSTKSPSSRASATLQIKTSTSVLSMKSTSSRASANTRVKKSASAVSATSPRAARTTGTSSAASTSSLKASKISKANAIPKCPVPQKRRNSIKSASVVVETVFSMDTAGGNSQTSPRESKNAASNELVQFEDDPWKAARRGDFDALVEFNAASDMDWSVEDDEGNLPLYYACESGGVANFAAVALLLDLTPSKSPALLSQCRDNSCTKEIGNLLNEHMSSVSTGGMTKAAGRLYDSDTGKQLKQESTIKSPKDSANTITTATKTKLPGGFFGLFTSSNVEEKEEQHQEETQPQKKDRPPLPIISQRGDISSPDDATPTDPASPLRQEPLREEVEAADTYTSSSSYRTDDDSASRGRSPVWRHVQPKSHHPRHTNDNRHTHSQPTGSSGYHRDSNMVRHSAYDDSRERYPREYARPQHGKHHREPKHRGTQSPMALIRKSPSKKPEKSNSPLVLFNEEESRWIIANQKPMGASKSWGSTKNATNKMVVTVHVFDPSQKVRITNCHDVCVQIHGTTMKSLLVEKSTKINVVFDTISKECKVFKCKKLALQGTGTCPAYHLDKTDGLTLWMSHDGMKVSDIITNKCTKINVSVPREDGSDHRREFPLPEQVVHKIHGGSNVSSNAITAGRFAFNGESLGSERK